MLISVLGISTSTVGSSSVFSLPTLRSAIILYSSSNFGWMIAKIAASSNTGSAALTSSTGLSSGLISSTGASAALTSSAGSTAASTVDSSSNTTSVVSSAITSPSFTKKDLPSTLNFVPSGMIIVFNLLFLFLFLILSIVINSSAILISDSFNPRNPSIE